MGTARQRAERLADKLLQVRLALGLSQPEIHRRLDLEDMVFYTRISEYERGVREPPLPILLRYARLARVNVEALIDDELDLPERLPGTTSHEEIRRKFSSRAKRKQR